MDCRRVKLTAITSKLKLQMPDKNLKKKKEPAVTFVGIMVPEWESLLGTCPAVFQSCLRKAPSSLWPEAKPESLVHSFLTISELYS